MNKLQMIKLWNINNLNDKLPINSNWQRLIKNINFIKQFINEFDFDDKINYNYTLKFTDEFFCEFINYINFSFIKYHVDESFIRRNIEIFRSKKSNTPKQYELCWEYIFELTSISEQFIEDFYEYFNKEEYIIYDIDYTIWHNISTNLSLSESFMHKYQDKLNWVKLTENQIMSEYFIRQHKDKIYWPAIFNYKGLNNRKLSKSFKLEFKEKIEENIIYIENLIDYNEKNKIKETKPNRQNVINEQDIAELKKYLENSQSIEDLINEL
jgi:hypothetical protein